MMIRNIVIAIIITCFCQVGSSQKLYSKSDKKTFYKIYVQQSVNVMPTAAFQVELDKKYPIATERKRVIFSHISRNKDIDLTELETKYFAELDAERDRLNQEKTLQINEALIDTGLNIKDYQDLLLRYKNDKNFQKEIQSLSKVEK